MSTDLEHLYERDFYAWTRRQARELRRLATTRPNVALDFPRLIDEVTELGETERDACRSQLVRLIEHLLKLEHSPARAPRLGWYETIIDARRVLHRKLSRSLQHDLRRNLAILHTEAAEDAAERLRLYGEHDAAREVRAAQPYPLDRLLQPGWYPTSRHGLIDEL